MEPGTTEITVHGKPDSRGRVEFTMKWWGYIPTYDAYGIRGQVFHASLEETIERLKRQFPDEKIIVKNFQFVK